MTSFAIRSHTKQVKAAIEKGFSITGLAKLLKVSRVTVYKRIDDDSWTDEEIRILKMERVIV